MQILVYDLTLYLYAYAVSAVGYEVAGAVAMATVVARRFQRQETLGSSGGGTQSCFCK